MKSKVCTNAWFIFCEQKYGTYLMFGNVTFVGAAHKRNIAISVVVVADFLLPLDMLDCFDPALIHFHIHVNFQVHH